MILLLNMWTLFVLC